MFNQQVLTVCLIVLICLYLAVKIYSWWQGNQRSLFYAKWHNKQIGREGLIIELEKVTRQRDEFQDMYFRLQAQKVNSNETLSEPHEPELYSGLVARLKKMNDETKMELYEMYLAYTESQRQLNELKDVSNESEPKGFKEFNDFLRKENEEIKSVNIELDRAYSESQRELRELKDVSIRFVKGFELDFVFDDIIVDNPSEIMVNHYNNLKSILK